MQLMVLGLNHKTAPVEVRECFSFGEEHIRPLLHALCHSGDVAECVLLSTCNRTEVYAVVDEVDDAQPEIYQVLLPAAGADSSALAHFYCYADQDAVRHLFQVSASLDSLVIGEGQILSQVKRAYALAREAGTTGAVLNTLFNRAIKVGKRVRSETRIAYNAVSVSYVAVELAKSLFGDLSSCKVLLLGAGQMSELTARHLVDSGVRTVFVSNRNHARALQLAERFDGQAVPFDDFWRAAVHADIIITSTGAPHYLIRAHDVAHLMPRREGRAIIFIDIAVPRDVEPEVAAIAGVRLYNIDDLEEVVKANLRERQQEAAAAESIIAEEMAELEEKFRYLTCRPVLVQLAARAENVRRRVMKKTLAKLPAAGETERRVLENMSKLLVRKLLRDPMIKVTAAAGTAAEQYYVEALCRLFKLNELGEEPSGGANKDCHRYARQ